MNSTETIEVGALRFRWRNLHKLYFGRLRIPAVPWQNRRWVLIRPGEEPFALRGTAGSANPEAFEESREPLPVWLESSVHAEAPTQASEWVGSVDTSFDEWIPKLTSAMEPLLYKRVMEGIAHWCSYGIVPQAEIDRIEKTGRILRTQVMDAVNQIGLRNLVNDTVELKHVYLSLSVQGRLRITWCFHAVWEPEHGIGLVFENREHVATCGAHDFL